MNKHHGSTLDDLLDELGEREEVEALAAKRILAVQAERRMSELGLSTTTLAARMHTSRNQILRILDKEDAGITLKMLFRLSQALDLPLRLAFDTPKAGQPAAVRRPNPERRRSRRRLGARGLGGGPAPHGSRLRRRDRRHDRAVAIPSRTIRSWWATSCDDGEDPAPKLEPIEIYVEEKYAFMQPMLAGGSECSRRAPRGPLLGCASVEDHLPPVPSVASVLDDVVHLVRVHGLVAIPEAMGREPVTERKAFALAVGTLHDPAVGLAGVGERLALSELEQEDRPSPRRGRCGRHDPGRRAVLLPRQECSRRASASCHFHLRRDGRRRRQVLAG